MNISHAITQPYAGEAALTETHTQTHYSYVHKYIDLSLLSPITQA